MLTYSFNADLRDVLRRLANAGQNDDSQNRGSDEKGKCTHARPSRSY
jgi:hypothetical protein